MKNENNKTTNNTKTITEVNRNNEKINKIKKLIEKNNINIKNENTSSKSAEQTKLPEQTQETPIQKNSSINKDKQTQEENIKEIENNQENTKEETPNKTPKEEKTETEKNNNTTTQNEIKISNNTPQKQKNKNKKKKKQKTMIIILIILILIFIASLTKVILWTIDSHKNKNQNIETEITEIADNTNTEIIKQKKVNKKNPYWDFIKMKLINVDFTKLKKQNPDTVGWIQVKGTNINYPFVQTTNNDYYLNHSFDKSENIGGWVFLDYRNNTAIESKNTILYAHGMYDKTMFGSLKNIVSSGWLDNKQNYVIRLSTEYENTMWQVFSVYHIPTTNDYLKINFKTDTEWNNFTKKLIKRSYHNFDTDVNTNDNILTLSTCWDKKEKVVLHAKLIKREKRN